MTDLSPILAEFERLYDVAADLFWDEAEAAVLKQDKPIITLASKGRNRTRTGWYNPGVWSDSQEDVLAGLAGEALGEQVKRAEIVVATELLGSPDLAVAELCRQVTVHARVKERLQWYGNRNNLLEGIVGANGYYPESWRHWTRTIGCRSEVDPEQPSRGWSKLTTEGKFRDMMSPLINKRVFEVARSNTAPLVKPGSRMKKWRCDCTTVRCAVRLDATCGSCKAPFQWAEANEQSPYAPVREQNPDDGIWPAAVQPVVPWVTDTVANLSRGVS